MEIEKLKLIAKSGTRQDLEKFIQELDSDKYRTQEQHNALFLWFSMIETVAEEQGVTWSRLIRHTNQLKVTKANLHDAWKQLQKALFGTDSTKKLKKSSQIDTIIDHFTELFAKEGMELPEFPHDPDKNKPKIDYPEEDLGKTPF